MIGERYWPIMLSVIGDCSLIFHPSNGLLSLWRFKFIINATAGIPTVYYKELLEFLFRDSYIYIIQAIDMTRHEYLLTFPQTCSQSSAAEDRMMAAVLGFCDYKEQHQQKDVSKKG